MRPRPWVRWLGRVFGLMVLLLFFPLAVWYGVARFRLSQDCPTWPTTPGTITAQRSERGGGKGGSRYSVGVAYTYTVDGRQYTGTRVSPADTFTAEERDRIVALYRPNSTRNVSYNPADPTQSVLEPTPDPDAYSGLVVPLVLLPVGLIFLLAGRTPRPPAVSSG
jgi:hypothetical protein